MTYICIFILYQRFSKTKTSYIQAKVLAKTAPVMLCQTVFSAWFKDRSSSRIVRIWSSPSDRIWWFVLITEVLNLLHLMMWCRPTVCNRFTVYSTLFSNQQKESSDSLVFSSIECTVNRWEVLCCYFGVKWLFALRHLRTTFLSGILAQIWWFHRQE